MLNNGTNADITTNITGNMFVPKTPEVYGHDADGNLTNDGRWLMTWDAENRLVSLRSLPNAPVGSTNVLLFAYDWQSRRISKVVSNFTGGSWSNATTAKFAYDGWNLIGQVSTTNTLVQSYNWGTDLSGQAGPALNMQGAGGVGGLLAVNDSSLGTHFAAYDGNGNVAALVKANDGTTSANYEYSAFGQPIRVTGAAAAANPFRFSTKFADGETAFSHYLRRCQDVTTGRWLSRDPIGEEGSINIYAFVHNNANSFYDPFGLDPVGEWISKVYIKRTLGRMNVWHDGWFEHRDDGAGNTLAQRTITQMDNYYRELASRERSRITSEWQIFVIPTGNTGRQWNIARLGRGPFGIDFSDAGFWLNQANQVTSHGGTYELRCNGATGKYEIRNTNARFRWIDTIDSNANRNDPLVFRVAEWVNSLWEPITKPYFDVWIEWQDNRSQVREIH